jgi:hypothetical protein
METKPYKLQPSMDRFSELSHTCVIWNACPESGVTVEQLLKPEAWANVARRMKAGHMIHVVPEDGAYFAELYVVSAGQNWANVSLLREVLLSLTDFAEPATEKYADIKWAGPSAKFRVTRLKDGDTLRDGFGSRQEAESWLSDHLKAVKL